MQGTGTFHVEIDRERLKRKTRGGEEKLDACYVRWAGPADAASLAVLNTAFNGPGVSEQEIAERLTVSHTERVALGFWNNLPAGFACAQCLHSICYTEPQGELTELFVIEQARGQGLAIKLISFLEQALREEGVKSLRVTTGNANLPARRFYEKVSYKPKDYLTLSKRL